MEDGSVIGSPNSGTVRNRSPQPETPLGDAQRTRGLTSRDSVKLLGGRLFGVSVTVPARSVKLPEVNTESLPVDAKRRKT